MNKLELKRTAEVVEQLLTIYAATDDEVAALHRALSDLISKAKQGLVSDRLDWRDIPGAKGFTDGRLGQYSDLESAFASFRLELSGGETPALRRLREQRG